MNISARGSVNGALANQTHQMAEIKLFRARVDEAVKLEPGATLFSQGDPGDVMFAVIDGEVELNVDGRVVEVVHAGGIIGELALIDPAPRSATARARTVARAVSVDAKEFTLLVHEHPTFAIQVMRIMAERLRRTTAGATPESTSNDLGDNAG